MKLLGIYKNGNAITTIFDDGTRIRETNDDEFKFDFADNMDIKICNRCDRGCLYCHEGSTPDGKLGDILNEKFIETLHPYQEVALGGGNVLSHPDFVQFLYRLKDKKVITNITLNQVHFEKNMDFIKDLIKNELIYGLGVSLVSPTDDFIKKVQCFPNAVIHVINGLFTKSDILRLSNKDLKILILGYKHIRRGNDYYSSNSRNIESNQAYLKEVLSNITNYFNVVSFDNLAIEQLDVKKIVPEDKWEEFYQGNDGTSTYYIDMVERKFARSSTAAMDKRYDLMDSVDKMFDVIKKEK